MSTTILYTENSRVEISPGGPTVIIGERCNASGFKAIAAAVRKARYDLIADQARAQVEAGAAIINLNVAGAGIDEAEALLRSINAITAAVDVPLSLDVRDSRTMAKGLKHLKGKHLINSINGEVDRLNRLLPIMKQFGCAAIAMLTDDSGTPAIARGRLEVARRIADRATKAGIPLEDLIFDCVCLPASSSPGAVAVTLETMDLVRQEFSANLTLGVSNISYGLKDRRVVEAHFLAMAISHGLNCPITDPTVPAIRQAITHAEALLGRGGPG